jgi:hypothetical protein
MSDAVQSYRARVINLCFNVMDSCSLTDIHVLKTQAEGLLKEMGVEVGGVSAKKVIDEALNDYCEDLL